MTKYGEIFVELRGRYTAYEGESHSYGLFKITEFVRHSTAAADITACGSECEDIYGTNSPTCLAQVDGQCGSTRDSCVTGGSFDDDVSFGTADTATQNRDLNDQTFAIGDTFTYDFSLFWEGETSFTVVSNNTSVVTITALAGVGVYRATAVAAGSSTITVTATNADGSDDDSFLHDDPGESPLYFSDLYPQDRGSVELSVFHAP